MVLQVQMGQPWVQQLQENRSNRHRSTQQLGSRSNQSNWHKARKLLGDKLHNRSNHHSRNILGVGDSSTSTNNQGLLLKYSSSPQEQHYTFVTPQKIALKLKG